jgi:hypothetical protein
MEEKSCVFNEIASVEFSVPILWHADPLLADVREIRNYTVAITRQQPVNGKRGTVISTQSMLRCYKQDKLGAVSWPVSY